MSLNWSGPGAALRFHLKLHEDILGVQKFVVSNNHKRMVAGSMPPALAQRLRLMTAMSDFGEDGVDRGLRLDGSNTLDRDNEDMAYTEKNQARTYQAIDGESKLLNEGETHYVSAAVMASVSAAADLATPEPLFPTDLPTKCGLIVFESPLITPDLDGATGNLNWDLQLPVRGIGWMEAPTGRWVDGKSVKSMGLHHFIYIDAESYNAIYIPSVVKAENPNEMSVFTLINDALKLGVWLGDTSAWAYGTMWSETTERSEEDPVHGTVHELIGGMRRWLLAYFRWTWQRILVPETYHPKRAEIRPFKRSKFDLIEPHIKVVKLRRLQDNSLQEHAHTDGMHFDHQWIVRGHWRRQWFRSLGPARNDDGTFNQDSHRLVWIEAHLAGNPFGPLVVGHNVTSAVR